MDTRPYPDQRGKRPRTETELTYIRSVNSSKSLSLGVKVVENQFYIRSVNSSELLSLDVGVARRQSTFFQGYLSWLNDGEQPGNSLYNSSDEDEALSKTSSKKQKNQKDPTILQHSQPVLQTLVALMTRQDQLEQQNECVSWLKELVKQIPLPFCSTLEITESDSDDLGSEKRQEVVNTKKKYADNEEEDLLELMNTAALFNIKYLSKLAIASRYVPLVKNNPAKAVKVFEKAKNFLPFIVRAYARTYPFLYPRQIDDASGTGVSIEVLDAIAKIVNETNKNIVKTREEFTKFGRGMRVWTTHFRDQGINPDRVSINTKQTIRQEWNEAIDVDKYTPLAWVVKKSDELDLRLLIQAGANPDQKYYTNLFLEEFYGGYKRSGSGTRYARGNWVEPLNLALYNRNQQMVKILTKAGAKKGCLFAAIKEANADFLKGLVEEGFPIGRLMIVAACRENDASFLALLFSKRLSPDVTFALWKGRCKASLLHFVVGLGDVAKVKLVLSNNPNINFGADYRRSGPLYVETALHYAVYKRNITLVELLLKYGAKKDVVDSKGRKAIDLLKNDTSESAQKIRNILSPPPPPQLQQEQQQPGGLLSRFFGSEGQ